MALPIKDTPTLYGADARRFLREVKANENNLKPHLASVRRILEREKNMLDPNVQSVMNKFKSRAEVGMKKYGVDTARTDLTTLEWLGHAQAEAMDFCVYLERLIQDFSGNADGRFGLPEDLKVMEILRRRLAEMKRKNASTIPYRGMAGRRKTRKSK